MRCKLQRKEGFRELFRAWMMFDLAGKLAWHGGEDVYSGGKKDVAVLYEYWLFFKLLDVVKNVFDVNAESLEKLIDETKDGLCLKLKQGIHFPVKGIYSKGPRKLNVEFSYNRTFRGDNNYPIGGSWTRDMRPDYTLSLWPIELTDSEAEIQELITHIHFDAKYKVENLISEFSSDNNNLDEEKEEEKRGNYKRADILKMHTYRDAIRRTGGAYVLYPGDKKFIRKGFHEILPGLGAFAIKPGKPDATNELEAFIRDVVANLTNKASQREKMSFKTYEAHSEDKSSIVDEPMPELYGKNRDLIPDETGVLIGYYKSQDHLNWILKERLYNFRTGTDAGSLPLGITAYSAKFLVLHGPNEKVTNKIFRINNNGPRIFSKGNLEKLNYPKPNGELYLVYTIIEECSADFSYQKWDVTQISNYKSGRHSAKPLAVSLTELLAVVVK